MHGTPPSPIDHPESVCVRSHTGTCTNIRVRRARRRSCVFRAGFQTELQNLVGRPGSGRVWDAILGSSRLLCFYELHV